MLWKGTVVEAGRSVEEDVGINIEEAEIKEVRFIYSQSIFLIAPPPWLHDCLENIMEVRVYYSVYLDLPLV